MSGARNMPQLYLTCPALHQLPTPVLPHLSPCSHQHMSAYIHREEVCLFVWIKWNHQIHITCFLPHFTVGISASQHSNFFILWIQTHNQLSYSINRIRAERLKVEYCRYFQLHQNLSFFPSSLPSPAALMGSLHHLLHAHVSIQKYTEYKCGVWGQVWLYLEFLCKKGIIIVPVSISYFSHSIVKFFSKILPNLFFFFAFFVFLAVPRVSFRILVPRPGPLAVKTLSPNHWIAREFPLQPFNGCIIFPDWGTFTLFPVLVVVVVWCLFVWQ